MTASLLILGGTADARRLATRLSAQGIRLIYSVAGLVRKPDLDCDIVSGGFRQFGGLSAVIRRRHITAVLDATHPYAERMSRQALLSTRECGIPCWRLQRPAWQPQPGDDWQEYPDWSALLPALADKRSVFLSAGQLPLESLETLACYRHCGQQQLLRTAVAPVPALPEAMQWVKAIGPFGLEEERQLLQQHRIDAIVSKNSGGDATVAKLTAARQLGIPVLMLKRPWLPPADREFFQPDEAYTFVSHWCIQ
ncbi:precorrin-6A/cobalt-precorrin-6A reductase [Gynuella sunshinyii]|uniref:Precorrin-6x reductase n=1 Tax=Gynuella sunshinyii YC6258 TaxID=1445510 RepID=A0A0C5VCF0_9GAMM|nr:precorrin-6A/cobalt-precorrin-6A reductase [Gynuella sunshinyii]AJQ92167.1 precorrin-6x reductase [Gynuella sunshinyii YC6258]